MVGLRHFSSQMMLEYISEEKLRLDPGALHFYTDNFDIRTAKLGERLITSASVYWDPSTGRGNRDASVCVLVYKDDKNKIAFIHDIKYLRVGDENLHPMATQCEMVLGLLITWGVRRIGIEVNGLGNALPEILNQTAKKQEQNIIIDKIVNHQKKEIRILDSFEPLLTTGRLFINEKIQSTPFLSEMLGWAPVATNQNDDGLDAVAGALRYSGVIVRPLGAVARIINANTNFTV